MINLNCSLFTLEESTLITTPLTYLISSLCIHMYILTKVDTNDKNPFYYMIM
jgi:hypothetical protein